MYTHNLICKLPTLVLCGLLAACTTAVDNPTTQERLSERSLETHPHISEKDREESRSGTEKDARLMRIPHAPSASVDRERYGEIVNNGVIKSVGQVPVSTFGIDVDTGAYALVRRFLNQGQLPPKDAVRAEELINYFNYDYPQPDGSTQPFSVTTEVGPTPWNAQSHLVHVGIQGYEAVKKHRPASNLVFLIDVSGSMNGQDKLPLLKSAFKLLVKQMNGNDRISLVVYAGASGVVLEPTPGDQQAKIVAALERLTAGGSTHGSAGIHLAYAMAEQGRIDRGINRVILVTDGDFNVGTVDHQRLMELIEAKRKQGISLTTLGFGQGNYNDHLMEQLADKGNGNYAYIDTVNEAQKVLVEELNATLQMIAKDVKIQIEWNPAMVAEYRLIGYENRLLAQEDFNNDLADYAMVLVRVQQLFGMKSLIYGCVITQVSGFKCYVMPTIGGIFNHGGLRFLPLVEMTLTG
ncbi:MAG: VWA domain-containing protein [Candidatus Thiodiazotropha sp. (ex Lucinoma kastoroae)]|nr:VWA domain-containing protein [Candidatus Thiodiazotropha sp. (ex Lucinoma kastoroae)]